MPTDYSGLPQNILSNLPSAKAIQSTTNATPIVVTTTTPHLMNTGDFVYLTGAQDPSANIYGQVGTVTATTFELLYPDGTNVIGSLAGGAFGNLLSLAFGTRVPLPDDVTDDMDAASVDVPMEELADRTSALLYLVQRFQATTQHYTGTFGNETITGTGNWEDANLAWKDIQQCESGDEYQVQIQCIANTTAGTHKIRAAIYEDHGGAGEVLVGLFEYPVGPIALDGVPRDYNLIGGFRGTRAGTTRVIVQAKSTIGNDVEIAAAIDPGHILVMRNRQGFGF